MLINRNPDSYSPNSHGGTLEALTLPGDPAFTAIARVACYEWGVWPEELVGRRRAGEAVPDEDSLPLSYRSIEPSRLGHVVQTRRVAWYIASQLTDSSADEIGEVFGGHKAATVRPYMNGTDIFDRQYPIVNPPMSRIVTNLCLAAEFAIGLEHL